MVPSPKIAFDTGTGNSIVSNAIFGDGTIDIELINNRNNNPPAPCLTSENSPRGSTTTAANLQAAPGTTYRIQLFTNSASDPPSGEMFLGESTVTTDATGLAVITVTLPVTVAADRFVTATATSQATGDTSTFSAPVVPPQVSIA